MFKKILIANCREIACRIIKTARRMGIATVAVYSDADARTPFVWMADEAVHIEPSPVAQSYLIIGGVIPPQDYDFLREAGVQGICGSGSNVLECAADMLRLLGHNMPPVEG